jgi:hypothetical protein
MVCFCCLPHCSTQPIHAHQPEPVCKLPPDLSFVFALDCICARPTSFSFRLCFGRRQLAPSSRCLSIFIRDCHFCLSLRNN